MIIRMLITILQLSLAAQAPLDTIGPAANRDPSPSTLPQLGPHRFALADVNAITVARSGAEQQPDRRTESERPAAHPVYERGLLWKISGTGAAPSYLFGTIHIEDPRVLALPAVVEEALNRSTSLILEADLDLTSIGGIATKMVLTDGQTLRGILGPPLYREVEQLLERRGIPAVLTNTFKPWAAAVLLSTPASSSGVFLDRKLYLLAQQARKPIYGIETLDEQLALFDGLSGRNQIQLVRDAVAQHAQLPELIESLTRAYLRRDLAELVTLTESIQSPDQHTADTVKLRLITERNGIMVKRILTRLQEGGVFIAVGALHLPGDDGILRRLAARGLQLSAVY